MRIGVLVAVVFVLVLGQVARGDLVAKWTFDGHTSDVSGNGHHVNSAINTAFGLDRHGQSGMAADFLNNGVESVMRVTNSAAFNPNELSIAMWVKMKAESPGSATGVGLFYNYRAFSFIDGYAMGIDYTSGAFVMSTQASGVADGLYTGPIVNANEWTHLAAVFATTEFRLYVNGIESANKSIASLNYDPSSLPNLAIGSQSHVPGNPTHSYVGLMDDVYFFDHALTTSEVASLASIPEPSSAILGLVAVSVLLFRRRRNE